MDQEKKALWVEALRSGHYQQGTGNLHSVKDNEHFYCCLGVLCELADMDGVSLRKSDYPRDSITSGHTIILTYNGYDDFPPREVQDWAGLDSPNPGTEEITYVDNQAMKVTLSWLNDNGKTFSEIADIIERDL